MDHKTVNLYSTSMSADELAACLHVKEVGNTIISPYLTKYISSLAEEKQPDRAQTANPFLVPVHNIVKRRREPRPSSAFAVPQRSSSELCTLNHQSKEGPQRLHSDVNTTVGERSRTATRTTSRSGSRPRLSSITLHPLPNSQPQDYKTLNIVSKLSGAGSECVRPAQPVAPYLLAAGGRPVSQLVVPRSPYRSSRTDTKPYWGRGSNFKATLTKEPSSTNTSNISNLTGDVANIISLLSDDDLAIREQELEQELRLVQLERVSRSYSRMVPQGQGDCSDVSMNSPQDVQDLPIRALPLAAPICAASRSRSVHRDKLLAPKPVSRGKSASMRTKAAEEHADPFMTSLTVLSRSASRNVFLESYVAEEAVRRCLHAKSPREMKDTANHHENDVYVSQANVLTAVHMDQADCADKAKQANPQAVASVLKRLVSELMQPSRSPSPATRQQSATAAAATTSIKQNSPAASEFSSPYLNTYSARDYVTHDDIMSVFDDDESLNFSRFKALAKKFYGRISKEKLWMVAKDIDLIEELDYKADYLYSFLFNR